MHLLCLQFFSKIDGCYLYLQVPVFGRTNQCFHLPDDVTLPVILIGPGTGVAPFIGYLDHRGSQIEKQEEAHFGDIWLICGFRHKERDYLFRRVA